MKVYENIWKKDTSKNWNLATRKYVVHVFLFQPSKESNSYGPLEQWKPVK